MKPTKVLLTGANGLLGGNILRLSLGWEGLELLPTQRSKTFVIPEAFSGGQEVPSLDLCSQTDVWNVISQWRPDAIIHTAAMTEPGVCEVNQGQAEVCNVEATRVLCDLSEHFGIRLIFISTDLVFDGEKGDYVETDTPIPISYYGDTKLRSEKYIAEAIQNFVILRTSLLLGMSPRGGRGLNERILADAQAGKPLVFFEDEYRTPMDSKMLARMTLMLATGNGREVTGLYHATGPEKLSRLELGRKICKHYGITDDRYTVSSLAAASPFPPRPKDCSLVSSAITEALKISFPSIDEIIAGY
ncbi:MAG: SDR family oxidoreductase [Chlorobiales bacterium]|nr:SDR family oxidoreductase [Chlorobiales bacterium]